MDSNKLSNWLQVGANIGILVGLILVGLQMRQNSGLLRMQLMKEESASYLSTESAILGDNYADVYAKSINDPKNMTLAEQRIEETMLWSHTVFRWTSTYRLSEMGLVETQQWKSEVSRDAGFFFSEPYGRAWWDTFYDYSMIVSEDPNHEAYVPIELLEYANTHINLIPMHQTTDAFEKLKENLDKYMKNPP